VKALLWPLFAWSAWGQPATVVAGTTFDGGALTSICLVVLCTASHCVGWHDMRERCSGFSSLGRRGLSQALWWRAQLLSALLWPLFSWSAWDQPATEMAGRTGYGTALASVLWVGVGTASH
jgi:hypothetical protein